MKYSLVQITNKHKDGTVDGIWVQNCTGVGLEEAIKRARNTESINTGGKYGGAIEIAVVEDLGYCCPNYSVRTRLKRFDNEKK